MKDVHEVDVWTWKAGSQVHSESAAFPFVAIPQLAMLYLGVRYLIDYLLFVVLDTYWQGMRLGPEGEWILCVKFQE